MKLIEQLKAQLEAVGATLDERSMDYSLHCDAPPGYVWKANGLPCYSIHYATNRQSWLSEAMRAEMPNLRMGLVKVADPAELAEHRWNLGEDDWGAPPNAPQFIAFPAR